VLLVLVDKRPKNVACVELLSLVVRLVGWLHDENGTAGVMGEVVAHAAQQRPAQSHKNMIDLAQPLT
jgi:hypothetical protein